MRFEVFINFFQHILKNENNTFKYIRISIEFEIFRNKLLAKIL